MNGSFKKVAAIASFVLLLLGALVTSLTYAVKLGREIERTDTLEKAIVDLVSKQTLHVAKYEELVHRVQTIDKNVYGIAIKLEIEEALKPDPIQ